ncbi:unnamed protein product [Nippostrongylus brasiliensis]|uniref:Uncharacterized protein n=1 Tax=Nippostrongylus brasiliensis TaxID=27835 RepID=A0A0N4YQM6_NIPBR|nr:unnamed protein product [Nippostrongylus brasiliensis]
MNKTVVRGREILLKLAAAKQRLPRHQIRDGMQPHLIADPSMASYNQMAAYQQPQPQPQIAYAPYPQQPPAAAIVQQSELVYPYNPTAEEANAELIANGDAWWEVLEESSLIPHFFATNGTGTREGLTSFALKACFASAPSV